MKVAQVAVLAQAPPRSPARAAFLSVFGALARLAQPSRASPVASPATTAAAAETSNPASALGAGSDVAGRSDTACPAEPIATHDSAKEAAGDSHTGASAQLAQPSRASAMSPMASLAPQVAATQTSAAACALEASPCVAMRSKIASPADLVEEGTEEVLTSVPRHSLEASSAPAAATAPIGQLLTKVSTLRIKAMQNNGVGKVSFFLVPSPPHTHGGFERMQATLAGINK